MSTEGSIIKQQIQKAKMKRKTTVWIIQVKNWRGCTRDDLDTVKKMKLQVRSWVSLIAAQNNVLITN